MSSASVKTAFPTAASAPLDLFAIFAIKVITGTRNCLQVAIAINATTTGAILWNAKCARQTVSIARSASRDFSGWPHPISRRAAFTAKATPELLRRALSGADIARWSTIALSVSQGFTSMRIAANCVLGILRANYNRILLAGIATSGGMWNAIYARRVINWWVERSA